MGPAGGRPPALATQAGACWHGPAPVRPQRHMSMLRLRSVVAAAAPSSSRASRTCLAIGAPASGFSRTDSSWTGTVRRIRPSAAAPAASSDRLSRPSEVIAVAAAASPSASSTCRAPAAPPNSAQLLRSSRLSVALAPSDWARAAAASAPPSLHDWSASSVRVVLLSSAEKSATALEVGSFGEVRAGT